MKRSDLAIKNPNLPNGAFLDADRTIYISHYCWDGYFLKDGKEEPSLSITLSQGINGFKLSDEQAAACREIVNLISLWNSDGIEHDDFKERYNKIIDTLTGAVRADK
jgi:hypothetical protein